MKIVYSKENYSSVTDDSRAVTFMLQLFTVRAMQVWTDRNTISIGDPRDRNDHTKLKQAL